MHDAVIIPFNTKKWERTPASYKCLTSLYCKLVQYWRWKDSLFPLVPRETSVWNLLHKALRTVADHLLHMCNFNMTPWIAHFLYFLWTVTFVFHNLLTEQFYSRSSNFKGLIPQFEFCCPVITSMAGALKQHYLVFYLWNYIFRMIIMIVCI